MKKLCSRLSESMQNEMAALFEGEILKASEIACFPEILFITQEW